MKTGWNVFVNICLMLLSVTLVLACFEIFLRTGFFDEANSSEPTWIPCKFQKTNEEINRKNESFSKQNTFGFNDKERHIEKPQGVYRIAVLGDSFIWGDGMAYDDVWSHKLEHKLAGYPDKVEVMSWGLRGWSTRDELNFLERDGHKFGIDLLIVSFCTNDPDTGYYRQIYFNTAERKFLAPIRAIFPNAIEFIGMHLDSVIYRYFKDWGYVHWREKLYTEENLERYDALLRAFSGFCSRHNIDVLFVLVPDSCDSQYEVKFNKIIHLLDKNHIKYLDTYPAVKKDLGSVTTRQLWANPGNGHPGKLITEKVADEVYRYLIRVGRLASA